MMDSTTPTVIASQLTVAKALISQRHLDVKATLLMLKALPNDIGDEARASVKEALTDVRAAGKGGGSREAFARYALARVITMLERETRRSAARTDPAASATIVPTTIRRMSRHGA